MPEALFYHPFFEVFIFITGACIGSFLNVCIYRIPLEVSIVTPRSHCSSCGTSIPWFYNLPLLSWPMLRGRCHSCGIRIDFRYWLIELATAVGALFLWRHFRYHPPLFFIYAFFCASLLVASLIDIDYYIIPDRFTLGGILAGLAASALYPALHHEHQAWKAVSTAFKGAAVGGGLLFLVAKVGTHVFKKEAMGLGDVKFLAAIGAFLGWQATLFTIAISSLIGSLAGFVLIIRKQKAWGLRMAYGPYLAIAAIAWIFGGNHWTDEYLRLWRNAMGYGP